jgi:hypothetical protein
VHVAAVEERMHDDARDAFALREIDERREMLHVRVDPTRGDETHEVERAALSHRGAGLAQRGVLKEGAIVDRVVDADELLYWM